MALGFKDWFYHSWYCTSFSSYRRPWNIDIIQYLFKRSKRRALPCSPKWSCYMSAMLKRHTSDYLNFVMNPAENGYLSARKNDCPGKTRLVSGISVIYLNLVVSRHLGNWNWLSIDDCRNHANFSGIQHLEISQLSLNVLSVWLSIKVLPIVQPFYS